MTYGLAKSNTGYNWRSQLLPSENYTSFDTPAPTSLRSATATEMQQLRAAAARANAYDDSAMISSRPDGRIALMQQELLYVKQDSGAMKNAIMILEKDRDNLRQAIRKLKVENSRMKTRTKHMGEAMKAGGLKTDDMETDGVDFGDEVEYDSLTDFILIGGATDPLSLRHEVAIRDENGLEHKSSERYLWFKMAEHFKDTEAADKIRTADNGAKAEEEMAKIKGFDEAQWNLVKMKFWEEGQRIKFDQVRHLQSLLVYSGDKYLAVASQDKVWGTGWRKQRIESWRPKMWDGENMGGKVLMKLRTDLKTNHAWMGPHEEQETAKKFQDLQKTVWSKQANITRDNKRQAGGVQNGGGLGLGRGLGGLTNTRGRGNNRGRGAGSKRARRAAE